MKTRKQILASFLVVAMLVTGLMITPMDAKAEEVVAPDGTGVQYILDTENYNFMDFWNADEEERTAPTREGYVFGGWYSKVSENKMKAVTEEEAATILNGGGIYAKFVPAQVLSVRTQLEAETAKDDGKDKPTTYLRLLSAVNGLNYKKVGFEILYNKNYRDTNEENNTKANNLTKVYKTITDIENSTTGLEADGIFGSAATHFSVLRLDDIYAQNFAKVIYVTPHWTTLDGTTVYGQAKYVRVMDNYASNRFISIPVNFLEGSAVVAGQMEVNYPSEKLEVVGFDSGVLMPEMNYYDDKAGVVKVVGNIEGAPADRTKGVEPETNIYANVWFKVKSGVTIEDETELQFTVKNCSFCNWEEEMVDVTPWDVTYLK